MIIRSIRISIFFLLTVCYYGAYSDLRAQIWEQANKTHRSMQIIPGDGKVVFSVSSHLFFSSDLGNSFTVDDGISSNGISGFAIGSIGQFYFSSPQGLFSSPAYNNINNENWIRIDSTNLPPITSLFVRAAADAPGYDEILAGTASGLWRRSSNVKAWVKIHDAGDGAPILQITAFNKSIYYRSASSAFASHDNGSVWKAIAASASNGSKTGIAAISDTDVFIAIKEDPGSLILHSTDGGNTFNGPLGTNFSSETIETLVVNTQGDIYLGGGVRSDFNQDSIAQGFAYRLLHNNLSWENFSAGLPSATPTPEVIGMGFGSNGNVFAGTDSAGLWRSLLPSSVRQSASLSGITLTQNYPNPANSATEFSVVTDHLINASIAVFDALGKNVSQIGVGELTSGIHSFTIDTRALFNGTYFYRLQTSEGIESRPFIVSRK